MSLDEQPAVDEGPSKEQSPIDEGPSEEQSPVDEQPAVEEQPAVDESQPGEGPTIEATAAEGGPGGDDHGDYPAAQGTTVDEVHDLEPRIQEIGLRLFAAVGEQGPLRTAASLLGSRALQRRILARAIDDPHFKSQLFRFVDVYPSLRDSGDVVRHLYAYLDDGEDLPSPLDRLLASHRGRRLPTWAAARLTERGMQRMAKSLIAGSDATDALPTLAGLRRQHTGFTLDILGEACLSEAEAREYVRRYLDVLDTLPPRAARWSVDSAIDGSPWGEVPRVNLSLKVTSVYSQIDPLDFEGSRSAVRAALKPLFVAARDRGVFMNLDLEHFIFRDLTYAVFTDLVLDPDLVDYPHLGIVVQSYLRDSESDARNLIALAHQRGTPFTVRLVKGAYWDYETIIAAQEHWSCPVFGRKAETDAQFERLAKLLIENSHWTHPAVATHNIRSMAVALALTEAADLPATALEIQVLHGMAKPIRRAAVAQGYRVREYVPVGDLIPGMAYLVRRLLENTANESFLRLTFTEKLDQDQLMAPPEVHKEFPETGREVLQEGLEVVAKTAVSPDAVPPDAVYLETPQAPPPEPGPAPTTVTLPDAPALPLFQNEPHADFSRSENRASMERALATIRSSLGREYALVIGGETVATEAFVDSSNPARPDEIVGRVAQAGHTEADRAIDTARLTFPVWRDTPAAERIDALLRAAAEMRSRRFELAALEVLEAGKPWREADADVTEAIDFLEYYGREMARLARTRSLSDVPGEEDAYFYEPRGVAVVIAPWNFPLAIPTGMVAAALVAGNTVVFKPANPTPVLGYALVRILHEAGVPGGAVNFLPGPGSEVGDYLVRDPRVDLVAFTGSLNVGLSITERAASVVTGQRNIKKVVAEFGGKNAIIVDTDADLDAAVEGVVISAFHYAGQKCSACSRVIVLDSVYEQFVRRLVGAAASLKVGDPSDPGTRIGPVITEEARYRILGYIEQGRKEARLVFPQPAATDAHGVETAPSATGAASLGRGSAATAGNGGADNDDTAETPQGGNLPANGGGKTGAGHRLWGGHFIPPHVFVDVPPEAMIAQEEIFGPVLAVFKARDFDQALELALGVRYGLTGGLYSRNPVRIARAYREFRVGNLYVNRPITGAMVGRQPFGGSRMSGVGSKAGGPDYLLQFLEPRTVTENTVRRGFAPPESQGVACEDTGAANSA